MAKILGGKEVAAALDERMKGDIAALAEKGVTPTLAILRVGEKDADIVYERNATKRCDAVGVKVKNVLLPADVQQDELMKTVNELNNDPAVHGILMFRPLPEHLDGEAVRKALNPDKDVDGITDISLGGVFSGAPVGFPPCTAQAVMEILDYYGYDIKGKNVCVIGHSLVVGRPAALMALSRDATINVCHIFTKDTPAYSRMADIVIVAVGKAGLVTAKYLSEGQTVIDVGINVVDGKTCGDVAFDQAEPIVDAISPVPGGVGSVTSCVLVSHVVEAAKRSIK